MVRVDRLSNCVQVISIAPLEDGQDDAQELEAMHKLHRLIIRMRLDAHIYEEAR